MFGRYRVLANLGRGGMATVQLAVIEGPSGFNKLVVLKQILPEYAHDPEILAMFLDEARLGARLNHSNVVQTNEVGFEDDTHFLAMEYLEGQPLSRIVHRLRRQGGMPLAMHLQVITDLLAGLHYAHELADYDGSPLGVVHCDVNPHNTFVTYDGVVKVLDFGVAQARTARTAARPGAIKGKLAYMAPEQMRGEGLDRTADVFAVGVMLWEAATGKRPWKGLAVPSMIEAVLAGHFPAPCASNPNVPVELEAIILKAVSFDRSSRYATAAELGAAIDGYLDTVGGRLAQREVGQLISTAFAAERAVITSVIDEQLQSAHPSQPLPLLVQPSGEGDRDTLEPQTPVGSSIPTIGPRAPPVAPPSSVQTARRPRRLLAAVALVVVVSVGVASYRTLAARDRASLVASNATDATSSSSARAAAPIVQLELAASPAQARFFLDDVPLEGNPYRGERASDGAAHRLRVEAPGFVSRQEIITLDRNTFIDIELVVEAGVTPNKSSPTRDAPRAHATSVTAPTRAPIIVRHW